MLRLVFKYLLLITTWVSLRIVYAKSSVHMSLLSDITKSNVFVTYYSPQCQFSQHFLKVWSKLDVTKLPTIGSDLKSHLINCKEESDLCVDQRVKFYPSIRFHPVGSAQPLIYSGRRSANRLLSFISKGMLGTPYSIRANEAGVESAAVAPPESRAGVMQLTDENFESLTAGQPVFVKFYTDWCPHCRQLEPVFPQLVGHAKQLGVSLGAVNCETSPDTCVKQSVPHYPMLALFATGRQLAVFDGEHSVADWLRFITEQLTRWQVSRHIAASESVVPNWFRVVEPKSLTWGTFDTVAKSSEFLFVKFFAPWCAHCQRLAPVWDRLAQDLAQEFQGKFAVARVDCTEEASLCTQHGVRAYPTLLLYRAGRQVDSFRGLRDLSALVAFARAAVELHGRNPRDEM